MQVFMKRQWLLSFLFSLVVLYQGEAWAVADPAVKLTSTTMDNKVADKANNVFTDETQNFLITRDHPEFTLRLKSNPTTGYSWFLREYDNALLVPVKKEYRKPLTKMIGAPGYEVWTFRVKPAGFLVPQQTMLRMVYARPWVADSSSQLVFRISTMGTADKNT